VQIPWEAATIYDGAFEAAELDEIRFEEPSSLLRIGKWAFSSCGRLRRIEFPMSLRDIGARAFAECSVLSAVVPRGISAEVDLRWRLSPDGSVRYYYSAIRAAHRQRVLQELLLPEPREHTG
jgi:hypothetical protein